MGYFIIIRGPAGIGKSTIAKKLAKVLNAHHFSFDEILENNKLDSIKGDGISAENFVKANKLILPKAKEMIKNDKIIIFDGCFYRKKQLDHLKKNLAYKHYVFSLKAPLKECFARNKTRKKPMAKKEIENVYTLVSKLKEGINIETTNKSISNVTKEVLKHLPKNRKKFNNQKN